MIDLNNTIKQLDLTGDHGTLYPRTAEYTFFLSEHRAFAKMEHILGHKSSLNECTSIQVIRSMFFDHMLLLN